MARITIKQRETEAYALSRKSIIKVSIVDGKILEDNRYQYFGVGHVEEGTHSGSSENRRS